MNIYLTSLSNILHFLCLGIRLSTRTNVDINYRPICELCPLMHVWNGIEILRCHKSNYFSCDNTTKTNIMQWGHSFSFPPSSGPYEWEGQTETSSSRTSKYAKSSRRSAAELSTLDVFVLGDFVKICILTVALMLSELCMAQHTAL